jgi:hypothetical protein
MLSHRKIKRQTYTTTIDKFTDHHNVKIITKFPKEFAGEKRILIVELTCVKVERVGVSFFI